VAFTALSLPDSIKIRFRQHNPEKTGVT
jgi:hypothetical protein